MRSALCSKALHCQASSLNRGLTQQRTQGVRQERQGAPRTLRLRGALDTQVSTQVLHYQASSLNRGLTQQGTLEGKAGATGGPHVLLLPLGDLCRRLPGVHLHLAVRVCAALSTLKSPASSCVTNRDPERRGSLSAIHWLNPKRTRALRAPAAKLRQCCAGAAACDLGARCARDRSSGRDAKLILALQSRARTRAPPDPRSLSSLHQINSTRSVALG